MYFFLKEPKLDKETPIYLMRYINTEKKNFKVSTGLSIHPDNWDFDNRMPKNMRGGQGSKNRELSLKLSKYIDFIEDYYHKNTSIKELKNAFNQYFNNEKQAETVLEHFVNFINQRKPSASDSWVEKYSNTFKKLSVYQDYLRVTIFFNDINDDWLLNYANFLRELPDDLKDSTKLKYDTFDYDNWGYNDNTLYRHINFVFTFINWARGKHHNLPILKNPINKFQSDEVYLTEAEINLLENAELSEARERIRDLFLVGVYSGQRFSDYSVFEKEDLHNGIIIKRNEKTEKDSFIPLHPKLLRLLDKYDWKLPKISSQKFNVQIRKVCKSVGINERFKVINYKGNIKDISYVEKWEKVGSHTARRTFITLSAERQMPDHLIMKITGIRDAKTLLKYKKTSQEAVKDAMAKYWG